MTPIGWVAFVGAAAIGAPVRYLLDTWVSDRVDGVFPWGTFVINASGSLVLGFITGLALYHGFPSTPKIVLGTGFCGAYTTFSTFTFETMQLFERGASNEAWRNALGTLAVGVAAAAIGLALATL